ncbi:hypothetical protein CSC88_26720, partial [Klebsiella pneumoniae]
MDAGRRHRQRCPLGAHPTDGPIVSALAAQDIDHNRQHVQNMTLPHYRRHTPKPLVLTRGRRAHQVRYDVMLASHVICQ